MQNSQEQAPSLIQLARCLQQENLHIMPLRRPIDCSQKGLQTKKRRHVKDLHFAAAAARPPSEQQSAKE
jgi:hypothetical protein|eukprot:COSAG01_NODE_1655_length_9606_cov_29.510361_15_plen_69_part_00